MKIGSHIIANPVIAAPMAGVTDKPYRQVCRHYGAGMVVSEMVTSRADLQHTTKTRYRLDLAGEPEPVVVQIVGTEPVMLAQAAKFNVRNGAQIIDINMGCPAKKVCKKAAGSALLENEPLVEDILSAVVNAVDIPVTVKIRTGSNPQARNAVTIANIAQDAGVQAITIHGRTRQCKFVGAVEYDSIAAVKQAVDIPVIANGDICTPNEAKTVLDYTRADAVMIGRAAQGQPWLFGQIAEFLRAGEITKVPDQLERATTIVDHIKAIHRFYGDSLGVRLARKHIKWYFQHWDFAVPDQLRQKINAAECPSLQLALLEPFLLNGLDALAA